MQLYTVQLCSCTLYNCAVVHCSVVQLYTVQLCSCTLYSCAVVHCTVVQLYTVQLYSCRLYIWTVFFCSPNIYALCLFFFGMPINIYFFFRAFVKIYKMGGGMFSAGPLLLAAKWCTYFYICLLFISAYQREL